MANNQERIRAIKQELATVEESLKSIKQTVSRYGDLDSKLSAYSQGAEKLHGEIKNAHTSISNISNSIKEASGQVNKDKETADTLIKEIQKSKARVETIYDSVFGKQSQDGTRTGGLEDHVRKRLNSIDEQQKTQQSAYEELKKKVEGLLPGATSTGLAKSYAEQKDTYALPERVWSVVAVLAMIIIIGFGYLIFDAAKNVKTASEAFAILVVRLPIFLGATWLAFYAGKQQSQNKRLQQEYAHKETLARSLEGYKREIENLSGTKSEEIMNSFMENVVKIVAFNPSNTLDKSHGTYPPYVKEVLERILPNKQSTKPSSETSVGSITVAKNSK